MRLPVLLAGTSAALILAVNTIAISAGPAGAGPRSILVVLATVAVGFALQSAGWDPAALPMAILLSAPPLFGMIANDAAVWLIAIAGTALLVAGELNVLSWDLRDRGEVSVMPGLRLRRLAQLGMLCVATGLVVGVASSVPMAAGLPGLVLGACALVVLGRVMFASSRSHAREDQPSTRPPRTHPADAGWPAAPRRR